MWYVWNRMILSKGRVFGWCDVPKQYKTKRAAHMAVRDFTNNDKEFYAAHPDYSIREVQYIALPEGMKPRHDMVYRLSTEFV